MFSVKKKLHLKFYLLQTLVSRNCAIKLNSVDLPSVMQSSDILKSSKARKLKDENESKYNKLNM